MDTIQDHFRRLKRLSENVLGNINREQQNYEDGVRQYFQECWNLKDRIKNDRSLDSNVSGNIETEIAKHSSLEIAADLANRMKHFSLNRHVRKDAEITRRGVTIHVQEPGRPGTGYSEITYTISIDTGENFDLRELVESSLRSWREILSNYGIDL